MAVPEKGSIGPNNGTRRPKPWLEVWLNLLGEDAPPKKTRPAQRPRSRPSWGIWGRPD